MLGFTGASGFVGKNLINYWLVSKQKNTYKIWDRANQGSFLDKKNIHKFFSQDKFSQFLHLAWYSNSNLDYRENEINFKFLDASYCALEICKKTDIPFFTIGSELMYSDPSSNYGVTKQRLILEVLKYSKGTVYVPGYLFSISEKRPRILQEYLKKKKNFVLLNPKLKVLYQEINDCVYEISQLISGGLFGLYHANTSRLISNEQFISKINKKIINATKNSSKINFGHETAETLIDN